VVTLNNKPANVAALIWQYGVRFHVSARLAKPITAAQGKREKGRGGEGGVKTANTHPTHKGNNQLSDEPVIKAIIQFRPQFLD
jgi:hypothetical protein